MHKLSFRWRQLTVPRPLYEITSKTINGPFKIQDRQYFLSTPFKDLNDLIGGFPSGEISILGSLSGAGKTALALKFALYTANIKNLPVVYFSLSEPKEHILYRLISSHLSIPIHQLVKGKLAKDSQTILDSSLPSFDDIPIWIDDTPRQNLTRIRTLCRGIKAQVGLGIIVIDYLQLIEPVEIAFLQIDEDFQPIYDRSEELRAIMRGLKALAKEFDIPILCLSQMDRTDYSETNQAPQIYELAGSKSIEEIAHLVLLLHRPSTAITKNYDSKIVQDVKLIVARQHFGPTGLVNLSFNPKYVSLK